jgi:thiamine biosynthesis lipoprotein
MGTTYQVTYAPGDTSPADDRESIEALLLEINQSLSTYIETSLISTINRSSDTAVSHPVDDHFATVFGQATLVYRDTDGAFNPAVGPLVNAWGFGPAGATTTPEPESIPSLLELVDFDAFQMRPASRTLQKSVAGAELDFSAIAKGYGVDAIGELLDQRGIEDYFIEIGGEVLTRGQHPEGRPWRVGIEQPAETGDQRRTPSAVLSVNESAMATSGNYRNFIIEDGRRIVHILNPVTGFPESTALLSVSVLAADTMTADAYATALMVMGSERALQFVESHAGLEAYLITGDGTGEYIETKSSGFPEFSTD